MRVKEKLRNYHRLEETKVIRQLNSMWDSGLDCRRKRTLVGKPIKSKPTLLFSEQYCINVNFFISPTVLWYFNIRGKVGYGHTETLYYFCNSSISLKLSRGLKTHLLINSILQQTPLRQFRACLWLYIHQVQTSRVLIYIYVYLFRRSNTSIEIWTSLPVQLGQLNNAKPPFVHYIIWTLLKIHTQFSSVQCLWH